MDSLISKFSSKDDKPTTTTTTVVGSTNFAATATSIEFGTKTSLAEKGENFMANLRKTRNKASTLTAAEQIQLDKLRKVYEGIFGVAPDQFIYSKKKIGGAAARSVLGDDILSTAEGYKPDAEYYKASSWFRTIDLAEGKFKPEAKAMISILCNFQSNKANGKGVSYAGYPDDPENLFLEELKVWIRDKFSYFEERDKEAIRIRISYLDDVLCKEGLFDNFNYSDKFTVQKSVVEVRRILKNTMLQIDGLLAHSDAGRAIDNILAFLKEVIDNSLTLLWYAFREKPVLEGEGADRSQSMHMAILNSRQMKGVIPHRSSSIKPPSPPSIKLNERGKVELLMEFMPKDPKAGRDAVPNNKFVELVNEEQLMRVFAGEDSGLDRNFRNNYIVSGLYLESYALLMDLGTAYNVLKQAKSTLQRSGSGAGMLLNPSAGASFNALLELCERVTDLLRTKLSKIAEIGESRFEQLVDLNWATILRCPWIANYRELPRTLAQIEKNAAELFKYLAKARSEANTVPCAEALQATTDEITRFVTASENLTKATGKALGLHFNSYSNLEASTKSNASYNKVTQKMMKSELTAAKDEDKKKQLYLDTLKSTSTATQVIDMLQQLEFSDFLDNPINFIQQFILTIIADKRYYLEITTANEIGSGTDADVFVVLNGNKGNTAPINLPDTDKTKFEQGSVDRFDIVVDGDVGDIQSIKVGLSNKSDPGNEANWRIKSVELVDKSNSKRYLFDCKNSKLNDKKQAEATFEPAKSV